MNGIYDEHFKRHQNVQSTVKSKIFARVLFTRNFAYMRSFVKIKPSGNGEITLSFTYEGIFCHSCEFYVANMSFNAIYENNILAKICEFTVFSH